MEFRGSSTEEHGLRMHARSLPHRVAYLGLAAWAAMMYGLTLLHLDADFPYRSPWSDWSKTTDEGWYCGIALHHFTFGHWYVPDAFNPGVAMPVWPVILLGWFHAFGMGMVQARLLIVLVYGLSLVLLYRVLREADCGPLTAMGAVVLIAANPFCYAFDRMAILEPMMVFWWLVALWVARRAARGGGGWAVLLGMVIVAEVLTKSTGVLLSVSALYLLAAQARRDGRGWVRPVAVAGGTAMMLWSAYFFGWVRPHYLSAYKYLFVVNADRIHLAIVPLYTWRLLRDGVLWVNPVLFPAALVAIFVVAVWWRRLLWEPLFGAAVIAIGLYLAFILYHSNLQPRYYLVVAMPIVIVVMMTAERLLSSARPGRVTVCVPACVLLVTAVCMTARTVSYARHPAYLWRDTATEIAALMRADGEKTPLLWSASGGDIGLFTGIRSVALYEPSGFEVLTVEYQPRWLALWSDWDDPVYRQAEAKYALEPVRTFRVYDDEPHHQAFTLYRMRRRSAVAVGSE